MDEAALSTSLDATLHESPLFFCSYCGISKHPLHFTLAKLKPRRGDICTACSAFTVRTALLALLEWRSQRMVRPAGLRSECPCCKHSETFPETETRYQRLQILWKFDHFQKARFFASITFCSAWYKGFRRTTLLTLTGWLQPPLSQSFCVRHAEWGSKEIWWWRRRCSLLLHVNDPWPYCRTQKWQGTWWTLQVGLQGFVTGELLHAGTWRIWLVRCWFYRPGECSSWGTYCLKGTGACLSGQTVVQTWACAALCVLRCPDRKPEFLATGYWLRSSEINTF